MPQYLSPGVYVEEVPSAIQAIAGVGTSTAGFIGIVPDVIVVPPGRLYRVKDEVLGAGDAAGTRMFELDAYPVQTDSSTVIINVQKLDDNGDLMVDDQDHPIFEQATNVSLVNSFTDQVAEAVFEQGHEPPDGAVVAARSYQTFINPVRGESIGEGAEVEDAEGNKTRVSEFELTAFPVRTVPGAFAIRAPDANGDPATYDGTEDKVVLVNDFANQTSKVRFVADAAIPPDKGVIQGDYLAVPANLAMHKEKIGEGNGSQVTFRLGGYPIHDEAGMWEFRVGDYDKVSPQKVTVDIDHDDKIVEVTFADPPPLNQEVWADYVRHPTFRPLDAKKSKLCTNFGEFRKHFGDFSTDPGHRNLAQAVFGFFHNGGTRCHVARMNAELEINDTLAKFAAIDEIALVAAPGITGTSGTARDSIVAHCSVATQDRFAIFDSPLELKEGDLTLLSLSNPNRVLPKYSDYAAFYFPWIKVFDPAQKTMDPSGDGLVFVPPSGHMAGIYARVDTNRGVHKAPANEPVLGAQKLRYQISKAQQDGLNPQGVNCIRELNGRINVWGARTIGGDANGEWRYINVRRTFLFLRESIDEGTQWAVFEPNDEKLWAKITRNVSAFLTTVWRSGALFGSTPDQAFYVKCDAETNPPELREVGQVVTEIGVAVVRPAEFVIFRISQWQPQA